MKVNTNCVRYFSAKEATPSIPIPSKILLPPLAFSYFENQENRRKPSYALFQDESRVEEKLAEGPTRNWNVRGKCRQSRRTITKRSSHNGTNQDGATTANSSDSAAEATANHGQSGHKGIGKKLRECHFNLK